MASLFDLEHWNPWWISIDRIFDDAQFKVWKNSRFKWVPRIRDEIEFLDVVYTLRGPRRVGKTTFIKVLVYELLFRHEVDPRCVFYYPCDLVDSPKQLVEILRTFIERVKPPSERGYIFVDEVSMLRDWQRAVKVLADAGMLRNCTLILTGSHSMDVKKASETLAGRRGEVDKIKGAPDKILYPASFSEYVSTVDDELERFLRENLSSVEKRCDVILSLAKGEIPSIVEELNIVYHGRLKSYFERYMVTGGFPQCIHTFLDRGLIPNVMYREYVDLVVRDVIRWGGRESYLRQTVRRICETRGSRISWDALKNGTEIGDSRTVAWYTEILKENFAVGYTYQVDVERKWPIYRKMKKIHFRDPFISHAFTAWIRSEDGYTLSLKLLTEQQYLSALVEDIVYDHVVRFISEIKSYPVEETESVFHWVSKKGREVDIVTWIGENILPIEVKYKDTISRSDFYGLYDLNKVTVMDYCGIVISKNILKENRMITIVPAHIFLTLL